MTSKIISLSFACKTSLVILEPLRKSEDHMNISTTFLTGPRFALAGKTCMLQGESS